MESFSLGPIEKYKLACDLNTKAVTKINELRKKKTERGELMKEMMDVLNISRAGKFSPLTLPRMGVLLEGIETESLYTLISKCKDAGEYARQVRKFATEEEKKKMNTYESAYSKMFYWSIRPH